MSFAFPALIIFLLILPGIVVRYFYGRFGWGSRIPPSTKPFQDEVAYSVFGAFVLHLFWIGIIYAWGYVVDVKTLIVLVSGAYGTDNELVNSAILSVSQSAGKIVLYFLTLNLFAAGLGFLLHNLVRRRRWEVLYWDYLRFDVYWHYLFSGEMWLLPEDIDGAYISAIVKEGGVGYLVEGILVEFFYAPNGSLDRLILDIPSRQKVISGDSEASYPSPPTSGDSEEGVAITADYFVLFMAGVVTLSIDYIYLEDVRGLPTTADSPVPETGGKDGINSVGLGHA